MALRTVSPSIAAQAHRTVLQNGKLVRVLLVRADGKDGRVANDKLPVSLAWEKAGRVQTAVSLASSRHVACRGPTSFAVAAP